MTNVFFNMRFINTVNTHTDREHTRTSISVSSPATRTYLFKKATLYTTAVEYYRKFIKKHYHLHHTNKYIYWQNKYNYKYRENESAPIKGDNWKLLTVGCTAELLALR